MLSFLSGVISEEDRIRVLVVEDNPIQQKVAALMLRRLGAVVDIAENGDKAVLASERITYTFLLMDCQMPVMDGFSATSRIRQRELSTREHVLIIGCSADSNREVCLIAGMDDFIEKPCTSSVLSELIERSKISQPLEVASNAC